MSNQENGLTFEKLNSIYQELKQKYPEPDLSPNWITPNAKGDNRYFVSPSTFAYLKNEIGKEDAESTVLSDKIIVAGMVRIFGWKIIPDTRIEDSGIYYEDKGTNELRPVLYFNFNKETKDRIKGKLARGHFPMP